MSLRVTNRSAPTSPVVPVLVYEDAGQALEWLCRVFGFTERLRAANPRGVVTHAQLTAGGGDVMIGGRGGEYRPPEADEITQFVLVHVDDVDAHYERARQHGARIVNPPAEMPFGERQYTVHDIGGHRWTFSQSVADVAPEAWGGRTAQSP